MLTKIVGLASIDIILHSNDVDGSGDVDGRDGSNGWGMGFSM